MKKFTTLLTAAAAALTLSVTSAASAAAAAQQDGKLVVLGDSIATGYGLDGYMAGDPYSAEGSFANQLGADYAEYINLAVDGRTSGELMSSLSEGETSGAVSAADTVVISICGNDFLQPMISAAQEVFAQNSDTLSKLQSASMSDISEYLEALRGLTEAMAQAAQQVEVSGSGENLDGILRQVTALNPDCEVVLLTIYDPFENNAMMEPLEEVAREKLTELNSAIVSAAEKYGAAVADAYSAFSGHAAEYTNILAMDIHPNSAGHSAIYSLLSEMLTDSESVMADAGTKKGSPDTGAEGAAMFAGIAAAAAGLLLLSAKKIR